METCDTPDFRELAIRLAAYGLRTFAEFGLGGRSALVAGLGLSIEDFVSKILAEYVEGRLAYQPSRGDLFAFLATGLRNDIIDSLRKAAHAREDGRAIVPREHGVRAEPLSLDEFSVSLRDIHLALDEERYIERIRSAFEDEPELGEVIRAILDLGLEKPQQIAEALGISTMEYQNRKKRLRRRLLEYNFIEANRK